MILNAKWINKWMCFAKKTKYRTMIDLKNKKRKRNKQKLSSAKSWINNLQKRKSNLSLKSRNNKI